MVRRAFAGMAAAMLALALLSPTAAFAAAGPADLEITQTAAPDPVATGTELTWTMRIENLGAETALNAAVNGNFNEFGTTTEFVSTSSVVNVADVQAANDSDYGNNHTSETVTAGRGTDVQLTKIANVAQAVPGDTVIFTITASNTGSASAEDVQVSDTLPAGLIDATAEPAEDCSVADTDILCSVGTLAPDGSFTAIVTATVDPAFSGTELSNAAAVTSTTPDTDMTNNSASATVSIEARRPTSPSRRRSSRPRSSRAKSSGTGSW